MVTELARKNSFSRILAGAIVELLPGAQIIQAGLSFHGYACDFLYSAPLSPELLERLSERMRQVIRENREIRILEMVPFSASEFFKKNEQKERASQVLRQEGLVRLVRLGDFADWCEEGEHLSSTGSAGAFKLLNETKLGRKRTRIFGIAAPSKKELKDLSSAWERFGEKDHEREGLGLWCKEGGDRLWLPKGLDARGRLASFWRKAFAPLAQQVEGGQAILERLSEKIPSSMELLKLSGDAGDRGLLDAPLSLALRINHFLDLQSFCSSFLQTIHKCLTILGFAYRIRCFGKKRKGCLFRRSLEELGWSFQEVEADGGSRLEFLAEDALRCEWVLAEIGELKLKNLRGLFATVWVERNLALLIEQSDGSSPFGWLRTL